MNFQDQEKIVQELDFSQSTSLKPRFQSVFGSSSQSHRGFGGGYCLAPVTVAQASVLEVEARVKIKVMTSMGECATFGGNGQWHPVVGLGGHCSRHRMIRRVHSVDGIRLLTAEL